jgi:superfamily I DNA and RNA helicase
MIKIKCDLDLTNHFDNPKLQGEKIVFNTLSKQLSEPWEVFYSVEWFGYQTVGRDGFYRDGEIDFILAHPKHGVFVCEVKGGIEVSIVNNKWFSLSKKFEKNPIKDPFKQAKTSKFLLKDRLLDEMGIKISNLYHLVILPEVSEVKGITPFYFEDSILITSNDLSSIENKILKLTSNKFDDEDNDINSKVIDWLNSKVESNFKITTKLKDQLKHIDNRIVELSEEQSKLFDILSLQKEVHILGVAGSGKTILATNKAVQLAEEGKEVLLICFNSVLGTEFKKISLKHKNLNANNYHKILKSYCIENRKLYENFEEMEEYFVQCILEERIDKYDAILIDETQDFSDDQISIIKLLVKDNGFFATFGDINQNIIFNRKDFKNIRPFTLTVNYRNTKPIFDLLLKHIPNNMNISHRDISGPEVKLTRKYPFNDSTKLIKAIKSEVLELIKEKIKPDDIVILTFKNKQNSILADLSFDGINVTLFEDEKVDNSIRVDSIRRFKGLDSKVVILTEMDDEFVREDKSLWDMTCYVAYSRARSMLIIIPSSNLELSEL